MKRITYIFAIAIALMGFYFLAMWVNTTIHRLVYPFPIGYPEDTMFFCGLRVFNALPFYTNPDSGFVAVIYTPGYFILLAWLFKIFGPSLVIGRVISLLCIVGIISLLILLSARRLRFPLAVIPPCIYLSLFYAHFKGFQEMGRVDPLMLLMVFGGLILIGDDRASRFRLFFGITLLTLACYVKQPALVYLLFAYVFIILRNRRNALVVIAGSVSLLLGIFALANHVTDGWFGFYTLKVPMSHTLSWVKVSHIFIGDSSNGIQGNPFMVLITLAFLVLRVTKFRQERLNIFEVTLPAGAATILSYLKQGGYCFDFFTLYTHLCFLLPFVLSPVFNNKNQGIQNAGSKLSNVYILIVLFGLTFQCAYSIKPWAEFLPTEGNVSFGRDYVNKLKGIDGEVMMPYQGYYAWLAGKDPGCLGVSLIDLMAIGIWPPEFLVEDVRSGKYAAILLPHYFPLNSYWLYDIEEYGYTGPTEFIRSPLQRYYLSPNVDFPPNKVYMLTEIEDKRP